MKLLTNVAAGLACLGMLLPSAPAMAAAAPAKAATADVALSAGGTLSGAVLDGKLAPVDGALISIHQGDKEVAQTASNKDGLFKVSNLNTGRYTLRVGEQQASVRLWQAGTAPKHAKKHAMLQTGKMVVRGQDVYGPAPPLGLDLITLWTLGASTTAAVLAGINQADINDLEDNQDEIIERLEQAETDLANIQDQLDDLISP